MCMFSLSFVYICHPVCASYCVMLWITICILKQLCIMLNDQSACMMLVWCLSGCGLSTAVSLQPRSRWAADRPVLRQRLRRGMARSLRVSYWPVGAAEGWWRRRSEFQRVVRISRRSSRDSAESAECLCRWRCSVSFFQLTSAGRSRFWQQWVLFVKLLNINNILCFYYCRFSCQSFYAYLTMIFFSVFCIGLQQDSEVQLITMLWWNY